MLNKPDVKRLGGSELVYAILAVVVVLVEKLGLGVALARWLNLPEVPGFGDTMTGAAGLYILQKWAVAAGGNVFKWPWGKGGNS